MGLIRIYYHQVQKLKLMDKKIFTILRSKDFFILTYANAFIGVAHDRQLRTCAIKNSSIQVRSPNVVKVFFHT